MATDPPDTDQGGLKASLRLDLDAYRVAVTELTAEVDLKSGPGSELDIEALLTTRTAEAEFHPVLECAPDGKGAAVAQLLSEVQRYRPNSRSSASDLSALVRIYLLSQIDAIWWSGASTFETDQDVLGSSELVSMESFAPRPVALQLSAPTQWTAGSVSGLGPASADAPSPTSHRRGSVHQCQARVGGPAQ